MNQYQAREIWNLPKEEVWALPEGPMALVFEDGVVETHKRATVFSYYMGVYHRLYPNTPLLTRHHLGDRRIGKSTHLKILGDAMWDCIDTYDRQVDVEDLCRIAYEITNEMYNDFTSRLKPYVSTISILDFIDVLEHEEVKKANAEVKPSQSSIDWTYQKITKILMDDGELVDNAVARMAKSGLVSIGQILQCVGPRGFLTDIDSNIFRRPILTGYCQGIRKLYDSVIESRSAAKALIFAKDPVAESEYFNREMQLVTSTLCRLHDVDCGSTNIIPFKVRAGDLKKIAGKYHREGNKLVEITENDRHLINTMIEMRSVLRCQHPDPYGVCAVCFGSLSKGVPKDTNIGHVSTTVLCEKVSQKVLSTKHEDGSSKVDRFDVLTDFDKQFIREGNDETSLKLSEGLSGKKVWLTLADSQAPSLTNIDYNDVRKLSLSHISRLIEVAFTTERADGTRSTAYVPVSMGSRVSSLSYEALEYIKRKGWELSRDNNYVIDLSEWDVELPLFQLPLKHTDMVEYMKSIKTFVKSTDKPTRGKAPRSLKDFEGPIPALIGFYNLVSSKLTVNIAHLETIILSCMIRSEEDQDHRLPRPIEDGEVGTYNRNMEMRSLGVAMPYQNQRDRLKDIQSFVIKARPDNPMDNLLVPYPVVNPKQ